jgi:hypothetical protein
MFAGVVVKFPSVERFLKVIRDIQAVVSGRDVCSAVGKFSKEVVERGRVELDLRDRKVFPLGVLGVYDQGGEDSVGGEVEDDSKGISVIVRG